MNVDRDERLSALLDGALELAGEHELDHLLERMVRRARSVSGARYGALGIYDESGRIERFVYDGIDRDTAARIGPLPRGLGLLGEVVVADGPIRVDDVARDPRAHGFPADHPPMRTFLGVPVRTATRRFGNLYLTEREDGAPFDADDERLVATFAAFAAAAVESALLVEAERANVASLTELAAADERARLQREMLAQVIAAQEAERSRVARDLHDQVGQSLTSVLLALRLLSAPDAIGIEEVRARTTEVRDLVAVALDDVRKLAFELRPTVLDDVGLVAALRRLAHDMSGRFGVPIALSFDGVDDDHRLAPEIETVVYRVVQEALTNVARHSRATRAHVSVGRHESELQVTVGDDGTGFDLDAPRAQSLGLSGMAERATLVGGRLGIRTAPGEGTWVTLEVPA